MHPPEKRHVFEFSDRDFVYKANTWAPGSEFELSKFDLELCQRWDKAMKEGVFRYTLDHLETRIIPGPKHYVAQLNAERATLRRKPQEISSVNQPFNPKDFNFTKVGPSEVIFDLKRMPSETAPPITNTKLSKTIELEKSKGEGDDSQAAESQSHPEAPAVEINGLVEAQHDKNPDGHHTLIVNVSPMERGHSLLAAFVDDCRPQIITEASMKVALEMLLLSKHRGFRLAFNSMCAFASVNHSHYHAYYMEHELVVDHCPVTHLTGSLYENTTTAVPGFAFQLLGSGIEDLSRDIHKVTNYFQKADIAHNLFICRGVAFGERRDSTNTTLRVFVWPREKFIGSKSVEEFVVACVELGGHLPIRTDKGYYDLTEEILDAHMSEACLPAEQYQRIKKDVVDLFTPRPAV